MTHLRHDGRIGHAEVSDAVHPQSMIHHRHGILDWSHLAGASLMIFGAGVLAHGTGPIVLAQELVSGAGGQRVVAQGHVVLGHGSAIGKRQRDLDAFDEDLQIQGIVQIIRPDDRLLEGIVAGQTEVSWNIQIHYA